MREAILAAPLSMGLLLAVVVVAAAAVHGEEKAPAGVIQFVDATEAAGLSGARLLAGRAGKDHLLDSSGAGVAFLDFDRDGWLDLFLPNGWGIRGDAAPDPVVEKGRFSLFRNKGDGTFQDVTERAGVGGNGHWGLGVAAADFDGDGWTDLLVTCFGPNLLYRNLGDGTFEDVSNPLGIEAPGWNTGAAFFDADGDGDLDLFIAGYIDCTLDDVLKARRTLDWKGLEKVAAGPFGLKGAPDHFFRAVGGGRFVDATKEAGFEDKALAFGFGVRAADYDGDGDVDLFVANDSDANYLYRNNGRGVFTEMGLFAGCALSGSGAAQASMGVSVGDVDADGHLDLHVTTFADDASTLHRGAGDGLFTDATAPFGLTGPTFLPMAWGCAFADIDRDGDLDIVAANGHIYPQVDRHPDKGYTFRQKSQVFENRGSTFADVTTSTGPGFAVPRCSRGLSVGDYDNDGDLDVLMANLDSAPSLLRNDSKGGSWITVVLEDERGPLSAVGARVTVSAAGRKQTRDVAAGDSFLSTQDPRPHFGLKDAETVDEILVEWPARSSSVERTVLKAVKARQLVRVRRAAGG